MSRRMREVRGPPNQRGSETPLRRCVWQFVVRELLREHAHHESRKTKENKMASGVDRKSGGIGLGGVIVVAGIAVMIFGSFWIGLIIAVVGLVAFGGFAKGKWY